MSYNSIVIESSTFILIHQRFKYEHPFWLKRRRRMDKTTVVIICFFMWNHIKCSLTRRWSTLEKGIKIIKVFKTACLRLNYINLPKQSSTYVRKKRNLSTPLFFPVYISSYNTRDLRIITHFYKSNISYSMRSDILFIINNF